MKTVYDLIVIGAGASGYLAALEAKKWSSGLSVALIEKEEAPLRKVLASGNGRCNLVNTAPPQGHFFGEDPAFALDILDRFPANWILDRFRELGLLTLEDREGRFYPRSFQSLSVAMVLKEASDAVGIDLIQPATAKGVSHEGDRFKIHLAEGGLLESRALILATGSQAAPDLGGSSLGYELLASLGHEIRQPLPALVNVPGAGPGSSAPGIGLFANQAVFLSINVHNYDPLQPGSTAAEQYKELNKNGTYSHHGSNDKRKYYFHRAILGVNRAINYLSQRPEVDSQRIGIYGSSQGGMFALIMSSINPHIKAAVANVPAGCDHHGFLLERSPGWPRLVKANIPESSETAKYYDVVNFCRSLKVPVRVIVGFADTTCSPSSVYAAYNQILSKDKQIINEVDMAHSVKPSYAQQNDWLLAYLQDLK